MESPRSQIYAIHLPPGPHQILSQGQSSSFISQEDIHICGNCKQSFTNLRIFLEHKNECNSLITSSTLLESSTVNLILPEHPLLEVVIDEKVASVFLQQSMSNDNILQCENTITGRRDFHVDEEDVASLLANQFAKESVNVASESQSESTVVDTSLKTANSILQEKSKEQLNSIIEINSSNYGQLSDDQTVENILEAVEEEKIENTVIDNIKINQKHNLASKRLCACTQCSFITLYPNDLTRHMRKHTGERPYECSVCKRRFARKDKLQTHLRTHTGEKPYKCQFCNYAAIDICPLRKHLRTHTDERPFKCQFCPYSARDSSQLTVHLRTHTGDAPFLCQFEKCGRAFKTSTDLKRHKLIHSKDNTFHCSQCDYKANSKISLQAHNRLKHDGGDLLKCPENECNYTANGVQKLRIHQKSHKGTKTSMDYDRIIFEPRKKCNARPTTNNKAHICRFCNQQAQNHSNLKVHIPKQQTVSGSKAQPRPFFQKAYQCMHCPASFVRQDSWRSHIKQHQANSALDAEMFSLRKKAHLKECHLKKEQIDDASPFFMDSLVSQGTLEYVVSSSLIPSTE